MKNCNVVAWPDFYVKLDFRETFPQFKSVISTPNSSLASRTNPNSS